MEERLKKRLELLSEICKQKEDDEVDLFLRSIALKVKKLPSFLITELQGKVLTVVSEFESRVYNPNSSLNSGCTNSNHTDTLCQNDQNQELLSTKRFMSIDSNQNPHPFLGLLGNTNTVNQNTLSSNPTHRTYMADQKSQRTFQQL